MPQPSGPQWVAQFPGSNSVADLQPDFRDKVKAFISRLTDSGATVSIAATFRPPERAYLMHWCSAIAGFINKKTGKMVIVPAANATPMAGVDIDWTHGGDAQAAKTAAQQMVAGYGIAYPAALVSRHTQRRAIDMNVTWTGTLNIADFNGAAHAIASMPRSGSNAELIAVGKTFGVIKLLSDPPHWSDDGH